MQRLRDWIWRHGSTVAVITVPGLALWLPSGYSWGPVWLLLCALLTADRWWRVLRHQPGDWRWTTLSVLMVLMAFLWWIDTGPHPGVHDTDLLLKYLCALPCLAFMLAAPPRTGALWLGVAAGGIGGGVTALVQRYGLHMDRAQGYTMAIQFGDISLLLGLMALTALALGWRHATGWLRSRVVLVWLAAGAVLGLTGSLLSQSRGGWLALPLMWLAWALGLWRGQGWRVCWRRMVSLTLLLALIAGLLTALQLTEVEHRMELARTEVSAYEQNGQADTSIGQRFAHWRVALIMGRERPLLGWGDGYAAEKARLVAAGEGNPAILLFDHAHNEWLDMFARHGLIGVALLAAWFGLPILIFFPWRRAAAAESGEVFAIRITGLLLPVIYLGCGLTQVLFAHNSGHMVYLYELVIWFAALRGAAGGGAAPLTRLDVPTITPGVARSPADAA
ncbi:MAG: O-antigen ligase family protein [Burkholderiaceae bacterium]|jgi:O-antigen ligase|nr:O-antigen ligase family protein [Burkholderiaceae bacterium]